MNKKIVASILTSVLALGTLVGCGSRTDTVESNAKPDSTVEQTTLKIWAMGGEGKLLPQMTEKFKADNPNINVEVQALPWDSAHEKLLIAIASGDGPDIVQMGTSWIPEFADIGALMDLSGYVSEYPNLAPSNFFDSSVETTTYNDKYVGIPWYVDTRVLYYRTDILADVGYPEGPATWEELKDAATKLAVRGEGLYGMDLSPKDQFFAITYGWQNGSDIIKEGEPQFNKPEFVEAVTYLKSFFDEDLAPKQDDMDIVQAFKEGIKPMYISGPWMINVMNDQTPEIKDQWHVRTLPAKETNTSFVGGANLAIFNNTKNVESALKFISYMTQEETQMEWLKIANCLPSTKASWEKPELSEDPIYSVFKEQMKHAKTAPFIPEWEAIAQEVNLSFEKINLGGAGVQEELNILNKKAKELLGN